MNDRLTKLREITQRREFRNRRSGVDNRPGVWAFRGSVERRATELLKHRCEEEIPFVLSDERIAFTRSNKSLFWYLHDTGPIARFVRRCLSIPARILQKVGVKTRSNVVINWAIYNTTIDWPGVLRQGLGGRIATARTALSSKRISKKQREFLACAIEGMEALLGLTKRYAEEARRVGNNEVARILGKVPCDAPENLHEALQAIRIIQFGQYLQGMRHCGLGRMDQYLWHYYKADIDSGRLTRDEAKELFEEFFIDLNRDADLYPGMQQGDNGQSIMLGGCDPKTGNSSINDLTYLIIEAVLETRLIDPKINLRIDRNTPTDLLELGSELTKCGLGFPQYSNDEVVIPALVKKGYTLEDARDYSVAACWEYVIPGKALDLVNVAAISFPYAVDTALREAIKKDTFDSNAFRSAVSSDIKRQLVVIVKRPIVYHPVPFLSALFERSLEEARDITECAKYRNLGIHGAGAANAADAMAAILRIGEINKLRELVVAQDVNFDGFDGLRDFLLHDCAKVGNNDPFVDQELRFLFNAFANAAEELETPNCRIRPGSGTAMYYIFLTDKKRSGHMLEPVVGATSDGRKLGAPLASSLAPAHEAQVGGIFSVFNSFSHIDFLRVMNGGPLTIEFCQTMFRTSEGVKKLALLIKHFVERGLQQLQLNVLDVEALEDALKYPERHRNLVVRVWGWSGYFVELDSEFQQQIIKRHRYGV